MTFKTPEELYRHTLAAAGLTVMEDGAVHRPSKDDETVPVMVNELPLYVPTVELRAKNVWKEIIPFHPLCEDALRGQSPVYHALLRYYQAFVANRVMETITYIVQIAANPKLQEELSNPAADKILTDCAVNVKEPLVKRWTALCRKLNIDDIIQVNVQRDCENGAGEKFSRMAYIDYPVLAMFDSKDNKVNGADMGSKANKAAMFSIVSYVLKEMPREVGSSGIVPYYQVYLNMLRAAVKNLNELNLPFSKVTSYEEIDSSWFDTVDDIKGLIGRIPKLPFNSGEDPIGGAKPDKAKGYDDVKLPKASEEEPEEREPRDIGRERRPRQSRTVRADEEREERRDRSPRDKESSSNSIFSFTERARRDNEERDYDDDYDDRRSSRRRMPSDDIRYSRERERDSRLESYNRDRDRQRDSRRGGRRDDRRRNTSRSTRAPRSSNSVFNYFD